MNLQIINGCAGTDTRLPTAGNNPGWRYFFMISIAFLLIRFKNFIWYFICYLKVGFEWHWIEFGTEVVGVNFAGGDLFSIVPVPKKKTPGAGSCWFSNWWYTLAKIKSVPTAVYVAWYRSKLHSDGKKYVQSSSLQCDPNYQGSSGAHILI